MSFEFKPAVKSESKLRLAIMGPSGAGKTYTSLAIGTALSDRIAVIDTEHGSAAKYADRFSFETLCLTPPYSPERYCEAIRAASGAGYHVIVVDSLSHEWEGEGGTLAIVDQTAKMQKTANTFGAWREATPRHRALIEAILATPAHVIATMRSKQEYLVEDSGGGKKQITKRGLAPIQREGTDFEFDVVLDMDHEHNAIVTKTRCHPLDGRLFNRPGKDVAQILKDWLSGAPVAEQPAIPLSSAVVEPFSYLYRIGELVSDERLPHEWRERLRSRHEWTEEEARAAISHCEEKLKEMGANV